MQTATKHEETAISLSAELGWIDATIRKPAEYKAVLACIKGTGSIWLAKIVQGTWRNGQSVSYAKINQTVSHWMPLPDPPK